MTRPAAALLLAAVLFSCTGGRSPAKSPADGAPAPAGDAGAAAASYFSFADDEGREIVFARPFSRIVSLYGAHTENLFEMGAGDALVGVQKGADWPPEALRLPKLDYNGDPEYVIALAPDLVLLRPFIRRQYPAYIAEIEKAGIKTVSLYPESLDDFDGYILRLALLAGRESEARERLAEFHRELREIAARVPETAARKTVFFEAMEDGSRTAAAGSLPARAIGFAGGINIAEGEPPVMKGSSIARFGVERLLGRADEIDVYVVQQGAMNRTAGMASLRARPGFSALRALREGNVLFINEKIISAPAFRYLEGVRTLSHFLYPAAP